MSLIVPSCIHFCGARNSLASFLLSLPQLKVGGEGGESGREREENLREREIICKCGKTRRKEWVDCFG